MHKPANPLTQLIENETFQRLREAGLSALVDAIGDNATLDGTAGKSGMTQKGRINKSAISAKLNITTIQVERLLKIARAVIDDEPVPRDLVGLLPEGYKGRIERDLVAEIRSEI